MQKTAEQAIHDKVWQILSPMVDGNVYEKRPMTEVGYPFADFESLETKFKGTKNGTTASVTVSLNIWNLEEQRKKVSEAGYSLFDQSLRLREAFGYQVMLRTGESGIKVIQDRTVTPALWRCMINLVFEI